MTGARDPVLRLRVVFGPAGMIGPGKAELLERIARTGSIAASIPSIKKLTVTERWACGVART